MNYQNLSQKDQNLRVTDFYSKDERSLYVRKIQMNADGPKVAVIMLFPSDSKGIDTTCQKCINQALRLGFSELSILNIFSRNEHNSPSTDKINNSVILQEAEECEQLILAFGSGNTYLDRKEEVLRLLQHFSDKLYALKSSKGTICSHPLSPYCKEWEIVKYGS